MYVSKSHEWVSVNGKIATVGICAQAVSYLGEIVYIELPQIGHRVQAGQIACILESSKSASDLYSPVSGTVLQVNEMLQKDLSPINESPEQKGWLFQIELEDLKELDLLDPFSKNAAT